MFRAFRCIYCNRRFSENVVFANVSRSISAGNDKSFQFQRAQQVVDTDSITASGSALQAEPDKPKELQKEGLHTKPKLTPFVKNLFIGKFDNEMLVYPQLTEEKYNDLEELMQPIERFFEEQVDSKSIDANAEIPENILNQLKELGLFGQQIPIEYGGLNLNATEYARVAEATSGDGGIGVTLAAHQAIGLKGILIAGSEEQKQKYLPKLATGEHIAAFCLTEPSSGSDAASIQTRATLSEDGKTFHLNGGKIWISNGGLAHIFTVFAKTEITNESGEQEDRVTAFIVERAFGGITNGKPEDKLGIRGSNTCEVHFDNTPVPVDNVIGKVGGGFKIAMNILNSGRFSMGSSGAGKIKKSMSLIAEHALNRKQFGMSLSEFGLIKEKFAKIAITVYAMESMAYLTAGIIDHYDDPDVSVEAAIVKVFSSEGCWMCANEALQICGGMGYMKAYPYERAIRDARILLIFEGTNEILRLFIALNGIQHAGKSLKELVKQLRNPLFNPGLALKTALAMIIRNPEKPIMNMRLDEDVHPSLKDSARILEKGTLLLKGAVENALRRHGNKIIHEQMTLKHLADTAIDLYAMTACIGRASRSYSIGLKNNDHEMMLTNAFCKDAEPRILANFKHVLSEPGQNNEENYKKIANTIFRHKGWACAHPLARNW